MGWAVHLQSKAKLELMKLPYMGQPCCDCPFRKDCPKGWLGSKRMQNIIESTSFVCHKTKDKRRKQCAGHMLFHGSKNVFVSLANVLNVKLKIYGKNLIFENEKEAKAHHEQ